MTNKPKRHLQSYHSEDKYKVVISIINNIRSKYLLRNERCSIAKAIEIMAVHYGNGHNLVQKGVPDGITPYYYSKEIMKDFNDRVLKIKENPNNYENLRIYMGLEDELRKIMDARNELEIEQNLLNSVDRDNGVKIIYSYIEKLNIEFQEFQNKKEGK